MDCMFRHNIALDVCVVLSILINASSMSVSRFPLKSAPLLVGAAFGDRRHRLSSHRLSIFHVSICFVFFPAPLVFIPQSIYKYLIVCSPSCLCERLFVLGVC